MDEVIQISKINDFIFRPHSIYLHGVYESFHENIYQDTPQRQGKIVHETIENSTYSSAKRYLQGVSVYSQKYRLVGKIDIYDTKDKALIERKYKIEYIYDGQKYQLYAQCIAMCEAGYEVERLFIHSLSNNKRYAIDLPDEEELIHFGLVINSIREYSVLSSTHSVNPVKCTKCIYRQLCHKALC